MASANSETADADAKAASDSRARWVLALFFVIGGTSAILVAAIADIWKVPYEADKVFTAVLGVAGTWVSTILVFYFSRENFQAAQTAVNAAVGTAVQAAQMSGGGQTGSSLNAAMTSAEKLQIIDLGTDGAEASLPLVKMCTILSSQEIPVPITVGGVVKYVVHNSSLFRFVADASLAGNPVKMTSAADGATFKDFISAKVLNGPNKDKTFGEVVANFLTMGLKDTVGAAKAELLKAAGAQDIVVTDSGSKSEKILGLITSDDIAQIAGR